MGIRKLKTQFAKRTNEMGLNIKETATLMKTSYRTVQNWSNGAIEAPNIAVAFLDIWQLLNEEQKKIYKESLKN